MEAVRNCEVRVTLAEFNVGSTSVKVIYLCSYRRTKWRPCNIHNWLSVWWRQVMNYWN